MNASPRYPNTHARSLSGMQQGHDQAGLPPALPGISYMQYEEPSPPDTAGSSGYAVDHLEAPPPKRQRLTGTSFGEQAHAEGPGQVADSAPSRPALVSPSDSSAISSKAAQQAGSGRRPSTERPPTPTTAAPAVPPGKSKRVRTGCLTCRDRHLKCDEGLPDCLNCRKSSRTCNRGIRLNFTEIQCKDPPILPPSADWSVQFQDESRLIASEYLGGLERYAPYDRPDPTPPGEAGVAVPLQRYESLPQGQDQPLPHHHHHQQYHDQQQQQRQSMEFPHPYPQYERYDLGSRDMDRSMNHELYYQSTSRPPQPQPDFPTYDESQSQRDLYSGRGTGSFAPVARHPLMMQPMPQQQMQQQMQQMQQSNHYGQGSFPSLILPQQYPTRDDISRHSHSYRSSDVSSVTSSLVPHHAGAASQSFRPTYPQGQPPSRQDGIITPPSEKTTGERDYLNEEEEIFYMQRYIDEVAIWMDSLDHQKHFGRIVPYLALKSPMLLNALLACGVKHLELTNLNRMPNPEPANVHVYYDTATTQLLRSLQNPDRNMAECATTAVVLNVYEIMSEKPAARMSHIAGARALIRECGWDAKSTGIAGACFWLNIGMEILSCLAFNWRTAWDPDQWGLDTSFLNGSGSETGEGAGRLGGEGNGNGAGITGHETHVRNAYDIGDGGEEDTWVHRIFYVVARIANCRASVPRFQEPSPHDEQLRLQSRFAEWKRLKAMCDTWNNNCPRSMRPFGYAHRRSSKSLFPNIMLIRRAAVVGRLFYHMAMCVLHQINPLEPASSEENRAAQLHHAHQVCGIVAHTKDHGVASVAIRSLAIAACVLVNGEEQQEALAILDRIHNDTGWRLGNVLNELKKAWGWKDEGAGVPMLAPLGPPPGTGGGGAGFSSGSGGSGGMPQQHHQQLPQQQPPQQPRMPVLGTVHPLLARADFSRPDHPYQNWYRPPNGQNVPGAQGVWLM